MADGTHIEWTDATWQIVTGCTLVSEGCRHCYAATLTAARETIRRLRNAVLWYADQPEEHASVEAWANWFRAEPACVSDVVYAARAALSPTSEEPET